MLTRGALSRHRRCHPPSFACCPVGPHPRISREPQTEDWRMGKSEGNSETEQETEERNRERREQKTDNKGSDPPSFACCPVGPQPRIRGQPKAARRVKEEARKKERYG